MTKKPFSKPNLAGQEWPDHRQSIPKTAAAIEKASEEAIAEMYRQIEKWGEQNHHPYKWLAILTEEVGEACQESLNMDWHPKHSGDRREFAAKLRVELIQVAAVALSFALSLDRNELAGSEAEGTSP